jgi:hypothetical protein
MSKAANTPMIDDVLDLDQSDHDCFAEVAEVLQRHGKLERFDIALRHGHFDIADDEFLVETTDPSTRTLSVKPYRSEDLAPNTRIRETVWSLTTDAATASQRCKQGCFVDLKDKHLAQHVYRP